MDERYREVEVRILYDADTIDPNVGLTAFYRNIQINAGSALKRGEPIHLPDYVRNLSRWIGSKDSFRDQMLTDLGKQLCDERQTRNRALMRELNEELAEEALNRKYGLLGVLDYLFTNPEDPSLHEHARDLQTAWLPERERHARRRRTNWTGTRLERRSGAAGTSSGCCTRRSRERCDACEGFRTASLSAFERPMRTRRRSSSGRAPSPRAFYSTIGKGGGHSAANS